MPWWPGKRRRRAASADGVYGRAGAATFSPGAPQFAPHTSNAAEATRSRHSQLGNRTTGSRVGGLPGRGPPEVVRGRLQRSLLVAVCGPDLTLPFAGRGGMCVVSTARPDSGGRCRHSGGRCRTKRPGRASGANRPHAVVRSRPPDARATRPPPDAAVLSERWDGAAERPSTGTSETRWRSPRSECRTSAASTAAPDCCRSCASDRAHLGVARRVVASIRGGSGGVGLDVGEHAAAVPAREGPYQP
jgi:hypothetical protein